LDRILTPISWSVILSSTSILMIGSIRFLSFLSVCSHRRKVFGWGRIGY
jgi:hypothetical protein